MRSRNSTVRRSDFRLDEQCSLTFRTGYVGSDYPPELPIRPLPLVEMQLQESVQFALVGPGADEAWQTLTTYPPGKGWVRLGPNRRLFAVVMFHELHCLRMIQRAFVNKNDTEAGPHHVQHCLNYLRQHFLCEAVGDLEEGDFMERDYERERMGSALMCEDWTKVYEFAETNFEEWKEWASDRGICRIADGEWGDGICR
ncbi:hypothetical protein OE88DRAFT_1654825 [Heliocybe sulcata]|uniref:Oxidase ustYa n=1 Tax=Heliocybe sulcata TaxID=5364 RepID=A0A5C3N9A4_9AGAM|nr:hypothetical protein OE88DRAFT_1654825 [Heliocybe sulcata]